MTFACEREGLDRLADGPLHRSDGDRTLCLNADTWIMSAGPVEEIEVADVDALRAKVPSDRILLSVRAL